MVVLGPTLATCFQESVGGRLLPRWLLTAAAAQVCPALLLPLSDSPKISQPILSSCITLCSPQAAIKNVLFNQSFERSLFYMRNFFMLVSESLKVSPKHCESDSL